MFKKAVDIEFSYKIMYVCTVDEKKKIVMSCLAPSETDIHYESMIWNFKIQTVSLNLLWPSDAIWHGDLSQH